MKPCALIEFDQLDSTNKHALAHLHELKHGDVVVARVQTGGRGRCGRSWVSGAAGNLCMSIVIKPDRPSPQLASLSHLLAVCLCRELDSERVKAAIKWPNDVLVGGRKIAGILAESVTQGADFAGMALGIGVNLNLDESIVRQIERPATSLNLLLGKKVSVESFRKGLLDGFFASYESFMREGFAIIRREYLGRCEFLGHDIEVRHQQSLIQGIALDVDDEGALRLQCPGGEIRTVAIGEMFGS